MVALLAVFGTLAVLASIDILTDLESGTTAAHVLAEGAIFAVSLTGALLVARSLWQSRNEERQRARMLEGELANASAEASRWRAEARDLIEGLGEAIDRQFDAWDLTSAEKEVAILLLQGRSHKEVAAVRSVSQATARQQAQSIYRKARLGGRNDLAAFFLSGLMVPDSDRHGKWANKRSSQGPTGSGNL